MPAPPTSASTSTICDQALETMLQECERQGISRETTLNQLELTAVSRALDRLGAASQATDLQAADEWSQLVQDAQACKDRKDTAGCRDLSRRWLLLHHGVSIGDTILMYGWKSPREILVDDIEVSGGFMWLTGPTSYSTNGRTPPEQGARIGSKIEKVAPSDRLKRLYPERFGPVIP